MVEFSEVTSFMKRSPLSTAEYLFISTTTNTTIRMTGEHLIYTRKSDDEMFKPRSVNLAISNNGPKIFKNHMIIDGINCYM